MVPARGLTLQLFSILRTGGDFSDQSIFQREKKDVL
jgi:hypothetical protein